MTITREEREGVEEREDGRRQGDEGGGHGEFEPRKERRGWDETRRRRMGRRRDRDEEGEEREDLKEERVREREREG